MIEHINKIKRLHSEIDAIISEIEKGVKANKVSLSESLLETADLMNRARLMEMEESGKITKKQTLSPVSFLEKMVSCLDSRYSILPDSPLHEMAKELLERLK